MKRYQLLCHPHGSMVTYVLVDTVKAVCTPAVFTIQAIFGIPNYAPSFIGFTRSVVDYIFTDYTLLAEAHFVEELLYENPELLL